MCLSNKFGNDTCQMASRNLGLAGKILPIPATVARDLFAKHPIKNNTKSRNQNIFLCLEFFKS